MGYLPDQGSVPNRGRVDEFDVANGFANHLMVTCTNAKAINGEAMG